MKKASEVFKKIRFAKMDPHHEKAGPFSTDDEEHYAVSTKEWEQQVKHVKKRSMQEGAVESKEKTVTVKHKTSGKELVVTAQKAKQLKQHDYQQVKEAVKDKFDIGEYDQEGDMAKSDLRSIIANAQKLHDMIEDADNLPEWCQNKITLAEDYISTVANYLTAEMKEEVVVEAKKPSSLDKFRKASNEREKKHDSAEKEMQARHAAGKEDMKGSIDRLEKHLNKEEVELTEGIEVKKEYDDKKETEHGVYHNGKKIGYVVHHKPSGTHTAYHSPQDDDDYGQIDDFHSHHHAVNQIKHSAGVGIKEEVQKADVPAYLRKQRGDKPLTVADVKAPRKDSISAAATLQKMKNEETKPPFDKPYTTVKAVVTDKSGAKHGPMSRARDIARAAMKKQAEKMPVKKSIKESRKSEIVKDIVKKKDPKDKFQANPTLTSQVQKIDNAVI